MSDVQDGGFVAISELHAESRDKNNMKYTEINLSQASAATASTSSQSAGISHSQFTSGNESAVGGLRER